MSIPSTARRSSSTFSIVGRDVGVLLLLLGSIMSVPLFVSLLYGETYSALSFLIGSGVSAAIGALGYGACRNAPEATQWQGMLVAATGWLAVAVVGAVPLFVAGHLTPPEVAQSFVPAGATTGYAGTNTGPFAHRDRINCVRSSCLAFK